MKMIQDISFVITIFHTILQLMRLRQIYQAMILPRQQIHMPNIQNKMQIIRLMRLVLQMIRQRRRFGRRLKPHILMRMLRAYR